MVAGKEVLFEVTSSKHSGIVHVVKVSHCLPATHAFDHEWYEPLPFAFLGEAGLIY